MRDTDPIKSRWECLRIVMVWYKLLIFGGDTDIYPTYGDNGGWEGRCRCLRDCDGL